MNHHSLSKHFTRLACLKLSFLIYEKGMIIPISEGDVAYCPYYTVPFREEGTELYGPSPAEASAFSYHMVL